jgi:hypothetical protein
MQQLCNFNECGVNRQQDDIWNDDDDDDETKLTDRQTGNGLDRFEDMGGNRSGICRYRKSSADTGDGNELMAGDGGNDDGGWYDMFDVVARQDDWMTCTAAFAIHLAYDGLRLAAVMWLTEASRQFQLTHITIGE